MALYKYCIIVIIIIIIVIIQRSVGGVLWSLWITYKPPVLRVAWTSPPTRVWKATEWQIYVAPQGLVGRCVLWKSGYVSKRWAAMMDDWIQLMTWSAHGPANGSWLFGIGISCGKLPAFLCRRRLECSSHMHMSKLAGQEFGKPGLW